MKKILLLFFFIALAAALNADPADPVFVPGEIDADISQYPYMILMDKSAYKDTDTVYAFTNQNNDFELRYAFYVQTDTEVENIRRTFALFVIPLINNAAGYEVDLNEIELYDDKDVAKEYNGDIGVSAFIPDPPPEYSGGYAYMLVSFFYKMNQGIVMQTILFNDIEFAGTGAFEEIAGSFKFRE